MKAHTTSRSCDPANEYTIGSVRVEEKGDPTRGQDSEIDVVRPWARADGGRCHMGLCDSAPGTYDYPAKTLDAAFGYGAVVAAPCARLVVSDMSMRSRCPTDTILTYRNSRLWLWLG